MGRGKTVVICQEGPSFSWNSADVNVFWLGPVNRDGEDRFLKEKVFVEKRFRWVFFLSF